MYYNKLQTQQNTREHTANFLCRKNPLQDFVINTISRCHVYANCRMGRSTCTG